MVIALIALVAIVGLALLPQMWVKSVIARHAGERPDIPGSGGDLARHVLDGMGLKHVKVEETTVGDHYDPQAKVVRLLPQHFNGRSLSAIVIAALAVISAAIGTTAVAITRKTNAWTRSETTNHGATNPSRSADRGRSCCASACCAAQAMRPSSVRQPQCCA